MENFLPSGFYFFGGLLDENKRKDKKREKYLDPARKLKKKFGQIPLDLIQGKSLLTMQDLYHD